jgi:hypothetical protein
MALVLVLTCDAHAQGAARQGRMSQWLQTLDTTRTLARDEVRTRQTSLRKHYRPGGPQHPILILEKLRAVRVRAETIELASQVHPTIPMPSLLACSSPRPQRHVRHSAGFYRSWVWPDATLILLRLLGLVAGRSVAALGIFPGARAVFERLAPFVIGKLAARCTNSVPGRYCSAAA